MFYQPKANRTEIVDKLNDINPSGIPKWRFYESKVRYTSLWRKLNPDRVRDYGKISDHKRRACKIGAGGSFTRNEWNKLKKNFNYRCAYCRRKKKLTVDHIIPLSKGGTNYIDNIIPACRSCNSKKSNNHKDVQLSLDNIYGLCKEIRLRI